MQRVKMVLDKNPDRNGLVGVKNVMAKNFRAQYAARRIFTKTLVEPHAKRKDMLKKQARLLLSRVHALECVCVKAWIQEIVNRVCF